MLRRVMAFVGMAGLAALSPATARADSGPVIVIPSRARHSSHYQRPRCVLRGGRGRLGPGASGRRAVIVIGGSPILPNPVYTQRNSYHPRYGRAPLRGRNEIEPRGRPRIARAGRELLALLVDVVRSRAGERLRRAMAGRGPYGPGITWCRTSSEDIVLVFIPGHAPPAARSSLKKRPARPPRASRRKPKMRRDENNKRGISCPAELPCLCWLHPPR